ncbi:MAG: 2-oxoacid:acceptor oxidoreductase family protein [Syntrophales bacterium]|nr:2-oxoacid:acceptor oxidoreductase family protein [Syntrophales bacterium]
MKQQIIISGNGGQGILFVTRLLAEAGLEMGLDVLTSETHGMAMRGGTVISHVKVGAFRSPLIRRGRADTGLFLSDSNVAIHGAFVKPYGRRIVNTDRTGEYEGIDAAACAAQLGSLLATNLVLLGYAVLRKALFCDEAVMRAVIKKASRPRQVDLNLRGFEKGLQL